VRVLKSLLIHILTPTFTPSHPPFNGVDKQTLPRIFERTISSSQASSDQSHCAHHCGYPLSHHLIRARLYEICTKFLIIPDGLRHFMYAFSAHVYLFFFVSSKTYKKEFGNVIYQRSANIQRWIHWK